MLEQIHNSLIIKVLGREQAQAITSIRSLVKKPDPVSYTHLDVYKRQQV